MAELIRREPIVRGEDQEVEHALSAASKRWPWPSRLSTSELPTWVQALEEDKVSLSLMDRIGDLGLLLGVIDRAAGRTGPDFSRKFDAHPHLEGRIQESLKLFQAKQSLNRQAGLTAIEMKKFLPRRKTTMKKSFFVLQSLLADPEAAEQFKQFLKSEQLASFHEYRRLISQKKDPDFSGMSETDLAAAVSAVEATIAIEAVEGEFCGTVTAHTTSMKKTLLLYDSQVERAGRGRVKMMQPVICVSMKDELIITAKALRGKYAVFTITPKVSRGHRGEFILGTAKMRLQVDWSIMDL